MVLQTGMMNYLHPKIASKDDVHSETAMTRGEKIVIGSAAAAIFVTGISLGLLTEHFKAKAANINHATKDVACEKAIPKHKRVFAGLSNESDEVTYSAAATIEFE